jgi:hypothetical protein
MEKTTINKKQLIIPILILVVLAGIILIFLTSSRPITTYNLGGIKLVFRVDLRQANTIPVYPDEDAIQTIIWNPKIRNLTIVYVNSSDISLVQVEAIEISYKMTLAYLSFNFDTKIIGRELYSFDNLTATPEYPIIALVPPSFSNETLVKTMGNVIYIKGNTSKDFDLATAKFIMSALNITIS